MALALLHRLWHGVQSGGGKHDLAAFPHQQRLILLSHLPDVIPQQGDPLELAQVLAAVHPELQGSKG